MLHLNKYTFSITVILLIVSISSCNQSVQEQIKTQNNANQQISEPEKKCFPVKSYSTYRNSYSRCGVVSIDGYQPNSAYLLSSHYYDNVPGYLWENWAEGSMEDLINNDFNDENGYRQVPLPIIYQNLLIRPSFDGKIAFFDTYSTKESFDIDNYKQLYLLDLKVPLQGTPSFDFPYLYFGSTSPTKPNFFCFNWSTKKVDWSIQLNEGVYSSPVIANDAIFVSTTKAIYCLDRKTGKIKWQFTTKPESSLFSNPSFDGQYVYFTDTRNDTSTSDEVVTIHALEKTKGREIWTYEFKVMYISYISSLLVENDFLVVSTSKNILVLNSKLGTVYWEIPAKKDPFSNPENENIVMMDGKVYVGEKSTVSIWNIATKNKESEFKIAETLFAINDLILNEKEDALYCSGVRSRSDYGSWANDGVGYIAKISLKEQKMIWLFDYQSPHHKYYSITTILYNSQILACEMVANGKEWKETLYVYK